MPIPPGFRAFEAAGRRLVVAEPLAASALALGLLEPGGIERALRAGGGGAGRAQAAVAVLPACGRRLHLRPVRRGGLLAPVAGDRRLGLSRPLAELSAHARLRAAGAPVTRPALVAGRRRAGGLWSAVVGTLYEEQTLDGLALLRGPAERAPLLCAADAAGAAVARFHAAGGRHADLHLKNLLLRESPSGWRVWLVDLDRARVLPRVSARRRMAELMRLYRSLLKQGLLDRLGPIGAARFFAAYTGGDRALGRQLLAQLPRERLRLALHALHYR